MIIEDIYFDNYKDALRIAKEKNVFSPMENLQICYYDGEKNESNLTNLIHMDKSKVFETLQQLGTRIPTKILFKNENIKDLIRTQIDKVKLKREDTYFDDYYEALKIAKEKNINGPYSNLQICYYGGEEIQNNLQNLIYLPKNNITNILLKKGTRIPTNILSKNKDAINLELNNFHKKKTQLYLKLKDDIKNIKLNFNDKLRIYIGADYGGKVVLETYKALKNTLEKFNIDVLYDENTSTELMDNYRRAKVISIFKPHITININRIRNEFLNDNMFNIIWFMDPTLILVDNSKINLRKRDLVFHFEKGIESLLKCKGINSFYQPLCLDSTIYKKREDIKKEKKIVFIGSSYKNSLNQIKKEPTFNAVYNEFLNIFKKKNHLGYVKDPNSDMKYIMDKYNISENYILNIYSYVTRDYCVEQLCKISSDYTIEIYGYGWQDNEIVKPFFKGSVKYGENISKIYNSATYGFCPGGYILMQRTLESAFSQAIPLVLDTRLNPYVTNDHEIEDLIKFFEIEKLEDILKTEPKEKDYNILIKKYDYKHFINKFINMIKKENDK